MKILLIVFLFSIIFAQEIKLETDAKIDSLIEQSDAYVISSVTKQVVKDNKVENYISRKIQVNNVAGDKHCVVVISRSPFVEMGNIYACIKDTLGNIIKELKNSEVRKAKFSSAGILEDNNSYTYFELKYFKYPYILEYNYTTSISSLFLWPGWFPQLKIPVLKADFELKVDPSVKFHKKIWGDKLRLSKSKYDSYDIYSCKIKNIPELVKEDFLYPGSRIQNGLRFAPDYFTLADLRGSFKSWKEFSNWFYRLSNNKIKINNNIKSEILSLTKNCKTDFEKISKVYKYLQDNTRYVAILLGEGAWEPHNAFEIKKNKYGDCKDLSVLFVSLLKSINIDAKLALAIPKNYGIVDKNFVANQFNHCIACIPQLKDTIWVECTSDELELNQIPSALHGSYALIIDKNEGNLVKIKENKPEENFSCSKITAKIIGKNLKISGTVSFKGLQKQYWQRILKTNKETKIKKSFLNLLHSNFKNFKLKKFNFEEIGKDLKITFSGSYANAVKMIGKRIFFNPRILNLLTEKNIPDEEDRKYPVYYNYAYMDCDTLVIKKPKYFRIEFVPKPCVIENKIGKYVTSFDDKKESLIFSRLFKYNKNIFEVNEYKLLKDFQNRVIKEDKKQVVYKRVRRF